MRFLPIVERELRTAARRKSTFRIRRWAALFAIAVTFMFLIVAGLGGGTSGRILFGILTGFAGALAILCGIFLTSDCLSIEKREGTLGLLFLSNLKGYDVVLGKFAARSLNAFYGLLALLPVLAISLLLGGLTGNEFWRATLALVNGLFFSMTAGIWISALTVDSRYAMSGTIFMLVLFFVGLPAIGLLSSRITVLQAIGWCQLLSPTIAFKYADEMKYLSAPKYYWGALAASHAVGWLFVATASWVLPRIWQQKTGGAMGSTLFMSRRSSPRRRAVLRAKLLPKSPILWLLGDEPVLRRAIWALVAVWGVIVIGLTLGLALDWFHPTGAFGFYFNAKAVALIFKLLIAAQACRFFVESRRNGALELLVTTPLRNRDLVRGQWLALRRIFLAPLLVLVSLNFLPIALTVYRSMTGPGLAAFWAALLGFLLAAVPSAWFAIHTFADALALGWFGMWLGLSTKKPQFATAWTIFFVLILPAPFMIADIVIDFIFIVWGATALQQDFRLVLARHSGRTGGHAPPVLHGVPSAPSAYRL